VFSLDGFEQLTTKNIVNIAKKVLFLKFIFFPIKN